MSFRFFSKKKIRKIYNIFAFLKKCNDFFFLISIVKQASLCVGGAIWRGCKDVNVEHSRSFPPPRCPIYELACRFALRHIALPHVPPRRSINETRQIILSPKHARPTHISSCVKHEIYPIFAKRDGKDALSALKLFSLNGWIFGKFQICVFMRRKNVYIYICRGKPIKSFYFLNV